MIPGGSASQPLEDPYTFPVREFYFDFENGICKVDGVDADPYDLLEDLLPEYITASGLALTGSIKAKGELLRTMRNALTRGALIIAEWEARPTGRKDNDILLWYFDQTDPSELEGLAANVSLSLGLNIGAYNNEPTDVVVYLGVGEIFGSATTGYVQRVAMAVNMPSDLSFPGSRFYSISMNGSGVTHDSTPARIPANRIKRVDLFGNDVFGSYLSSKWNIRKFHVMPLPFDFEGADAAMPALSDRELPIAPPSGSLGKDNGGKVVYRFGPFPLVEGAAANRLAVAALVFEELDGSTVGPSSVTFDGVAAECVASNAQMEVWQLLVTSGAEVAEIVVTFTDDMKFCVCKVVDFITDEVVPYDAKAGSSTVGADVVLADLAVRDGGRVLAMMKAPATDSATTWTWTGSETPVDSSFAMKDGSYAVSIFDLEPTADATTNDLTCDAPAGATTNVYVMAVSWAPAAVANDPHWSSVKLLLGFDGTDAATTFTAEESSPHALTFLGNAQLDTAQSKFGSASLLLDGTGDYVTTPDSADWEISNAAFTVEAEVRFNAATTQSVIGQWISSGTNRSWLIERSSTGSLFFYLSTTGSNTVTVMSASGGFSTGVWYHLRISFDGVTYRMYVNGLQIASSTTVSTAFNTAAVLSIGGKGGGTEPFNGWIDEIRFTKGICRNPGLTKFRRPTAAFPRA